MQKGWRIRVSIPVPRRCERRTLPIELIPHCVSTSKTDWSGVRTHASEEIAALTQRLRPLGHLATNGTTMHPQRRGPASDKNGLSRESNPGPLAPGARIMPLDH